MTLIEALFLVVDGGDGSGKTVQTEMLVARLIRELGPTESMSFPDYESITGKLIQAFLRGNFGDPLAVDPYVASHLYAADRLAAAPALAAKLKAGINVVANRYQASNKGHQGSKLRRKEDRFRFYGWEDQLEFQLNGIPKPSLNLILHVPVDVSLRLIAERSRKSGEPMDGHEVRDHLLAAEQTYAELASVSRDYVLIECGTPDGQDILPIDVVHEKVWTTVKPLVTVAAAHRSPVPA